MTLEQTVGRGRKLSVRRIDLAQVLVIMGGAIYIGVGIIGATPLWALVLAPFLARYLGLVQHNIVHLPISNVRIVNRAVELVVGVAAGIPTEIYRVHHVETHHRFENRPDDWTGPFSFRNTVFPTKPVNVYLYVFSFAPRGARYAHKVLWSRRSSRQLRRYVLQVGCQVLVCMLAVAMGSWIGVLSIGLLWLVSYLGTACANWRHHVGCSYEGTVHSSNVNVGLLSRGVGFNIGYHSAHHLYPRRHWSELQEAYLEELADDTPTERIYGTAFLNRDRPIF